MSRTEELSTLGNQLKNYMRSLINYDMKCCGINPDTWETTAQDRSAWRAAVSTGVSGFEARRVQENMQKRQRRKNRARDRKSVV